MKKIIIFYLIMTTFIYGQSEQTSSKIKVYTPSNFSSTSSADTYKWTVKTDIFSYISGEFPIIGEYRFAKNFSIEASAGITYGFYENFGLINDGYDTENQSFETKASIGNSFRAGFKYYPSNDYDAIEGWAFGLQAFTRTNNRAYKPDNYTEIDLSGEKDSRNKTGIAITISKQIFTESNISFEYILGIGFANVTHDFHTYEEIYDNSNNRTYNLVRETIKETVPNFQLGCRVGFGN